MPSKTNSERPEDIPESVWDTADNALASMFVSSNPWDQVLAVSRAILAERERCATICDEVNERFGSQGHVAAACARQIRGGA